MARERVTGDKRGAVTITLKALANSSPGFALKPWEWRACLFDRNSEGVATGFALSERRRNLFRVATV